MHGSVRIDRVCSSTSWHLVETRVLVVVAHSAAVRARNSLALAGPGLDSHLECHTRQPERLAHRYNEPGTIAILTDAIIGASIRLLGNKTRPPSTLATAHCHHSHRQPHPRHASSSIQHNTRRVFPARHAHRDQTSLKYHDPRIQRALSPGSGARQCATSN